MVILLDTEIQLQMSQILMPHVSHVELEFSIHSFVDVDNLTEI